MEIYDSNNNILWINSSISIILLISIIYNFNGKFCINSTLAILINWIISYWINIEKNIYYNMFSNIIESS